MLESQVELSSTAKLRAFSFRCEVSQQASPDYHLKNNFIVGVKGFKLLIFQSVGSSATTNLANKLSLSFMLLFNLINAGCVAASVAVCALRPYEVRPARSPHRANPGVKWGKELACVCAMAINRFCLPQEKIKTLIKMKTSTIDACGCRVVGDCSHLARFGNGLRIQEKTVHQVYG